MLRLFVKSRALFFSVVRPPGVDLKWQKKTMRNGNWNARLNRLFTRKKRTEREHCLDRDVSQGFRRKDFPSLMVCREQRLISLRV